jgi:hypothetical protein
MVEDGGKDPETSEDDPLSGVKSVSLLPIVTALFLPSAKLIGKELERRVDEAINGLRANAKAKNLEGHLYKNQDILTKKADEPTTPDQIKLFEKWVESVKEIDPTDEKIASMWRSLLAKLVEGDPLTELIMAKLGTLSPAEAHLLVTYKEKQGFYRAKDKMTYRLSSGLLEKGILEKLPVFSPVMMMLGMLAIALMVGGGLFYTLFKPEIRSFEVTLPLLIFMGLAAVAIWYEPLYRLTEMGQMLLDTIPPVEEQGKKPKRRRT